MQTEGDKRDTKTTQCASEHIAQRLNSEQALKLIDLLRVQKVVQGIGTPSRDEVLSPPAHPSNAMVALGGLFDGSGMDSMMVEMSVQMAGHGASSNLFDISIRRVKMAPGSGFDELAVLQIYPGAGNETFAMSNDDFQKLLSKYSK